MPKSRNYCLPVLGTRPPILPTPATQRLGQNLRLNMTDRLSQTLVAVFSGAAVAFSSHGQNLLLNGDFELPGYESPPAYRYLAGTAWQPRLETLNGWTILDDGVLEPPYLGRLPNYTNVVHHGEYGIALNQGSGIRTEFPVRQATPYQLSFWVRLQGNSAVMPLRVNCSGIITNVPITQTWTRHQVEFEATSDNAAAVVQFDNVSAAGAGRTIGLDDISLAVRLTDVEALPLVGWNADVVLENQPGRGATYFDASSAVWFESGLGERINGLPAGRRIASQLTPGLTFELQPYDQRNALRLTQTNGAGFLSLATARPYSKLYVLAASGNGGGNGTLTVHFTDGSHTAPIPFFAPDWWDGTSNPAPRRPAAGGFARSLGSGPELQYSFTSPGFSLHQTDVDLSVGSDAGKPVARIEFSKANGPVPWATSIFAVSGEPLPSPPALVIRDIQVLPDLPVQIRVPASADAYYLLYRGEQVQQIVLPRDIRLGEAPEVTLSDPVPRPDTAFYRVEAVPVASPRDTDGDGLDDVYELQHRPACDPLVADVDRDSDGDGKSNLEEFRLGTSPEKANVPPTVALTQPAPDSIFPASANIDLVATATDADGNVARVEFFVGNAKLGEDTEPPYTLTWAAMPAGNYSLSARAVDNFGQTNVSAAVPLRVELQNQPPAVTLAAPLGGAVFTAPGTVPITVNAADPDGIIAKVELYAGVDRIAELTAAPFTFIWTNVVAGDYPLFARALDDRGAIALSLTVPIQVVQPAAVAPAIITSSPASGEGGVAVTRETVLRLSLPLMEGTVVANDALFATAAGRRILSRSELSSDRRTLTLFYLENLPASSRVRITVKGDALRDALGRALDADADGVAGGQGLIEFDTLSTTPVAGTAVIGRVFASELVPGAANTTNALNRPLEGVTITVDGAEETLRTTTDAMGNFKLTNCPSGRFFVHVDGRTAKDSQWPNGAYYPFVGKAWEAAAGREDNLAGGNGEIYLPLVPGDALTTVSATQDTTVTFSPTVLSNNPALASVSITVPANSLLAENGTRGGRIGIAPVSPDRLPEPLPEGLRFPLVITIQTDGAMNFDRPVPVRFPNLPDPVSGAVLKPGEKSVLWSFNHDTGEWEPQGTMTVTADGTFTESDPGVGIRQPGWHGWMPEILRLDIGGVFGSLTGENDPCFDSRWALHHAHLDCATTLAQLAPLDPLTSCAISTFSGTIGFVASIVINSDQTAVNEALKDYGRSFIGCIPYLSDVEAGFSYADDCVVTLNQANKTYSSCIAKGSQTQPSAGTYTGIASRHQTPLDQDNPQSLYFQLLTAMNSFYEIAYASQGLAIRSIADVRSLNTLLGSVFLSMAPESEGGIHLTTPERMLLHGLPRPPSVSTDALNNFINRIQDLRDGQIEFSPQERAGMLNALETAAQISTQLQSAGWISFHDAKREADESVASILSEINRLSHGRLSHVYFKLENETVHTIYRGRLGVSGRFRCLPPPVARDHDYRIKYYDPVSGVSAETTFHTTSSPSVPCNPIPASRPRPTINIDTDGDGLPDEAEDVIGLSITNPDSDDDGILDGAEISNGTNPLDGRPASTGLVYGADTPGTAVDVSALNNTAVVADSAVGVAVFNVFNGLNPTLVAQVNTPGTALSVAIAGNLVAVADGPAGLAVIDLSQPADARIARQIGPDRLGGGVGSGIAQAVAAAAGMAFVGTTAGKVALVDLPSGAVFQILELGDKVEDLAIEGATLYAYAGTKVHVLPFGSGILERAGVAECPSSPELNAVNGRGRIFVGDRVAYVTHGRGYNTLDVSDPLQPILLAVGVSTQSGWKHAVANGSGRVIAALGPDAGLAPASDIGLFDSSRVTEGDMNAKFITQIPTPGHARAVTLYNGMGYVADQDRGLQIVNYLSPDFGAKAPTGTLEQSVIGEVTVGDLVVLRAAVHDDVQVRNVEFYANGERLAVDGNFPFEHLYRIPVTAAGTNIAFSAIATDMGGNRLAVTNPPVIPKSDVVAPAIAIEEPTADGRVTAGEEAYVRLSAFDISGVATIAITLDGAPVSARRLTLNEFLVPVPRTPGRYLLGASATDHAGNLGHSPPIQVIVQLEAISRAVSVFTTEIPQTAAAVSRPVSAWVEPSTGTSAESRAVSVWLELPPPDDAVSRAVSALFQSLAGGDSQSSAVSLEVKP